MPIRAPLESNLLFHTIRLNQELDNLSHMLEIRDQDVEVIRLENDKLTDLVSCQKITTEKLKEESAQMQFIKNEMIEIQEQMKVCSGHCQLLAGFWP